MLLHYFEAAFFYLTHTIHKKANPCGVILTKFILYDNLLHQCRYK